MPCIKHLAVATSVPPTSKRWDRSGTGPWKVGGQYFYSMEVAEGRAVERCLEDLPSGQVRPARPSRCPHRCLGTTMNPTLGRVRLPGRPSSVNSRQNPAVLDALPVEESLHSVISRCWPSNVLRQLAGLRGFVVVKLNSGHRNSPLRWRAITICRNIGRTPRPWPARAVASGGRTSCRAWHRQHRDPSVPSHH